MFSTTAEWGKLTLLHSTASCLVKLAENTLKGFSESEQQAHNQSQGSSNARYVAARLMPAHHDSLEEQEAQVPLLGALTEEQLAAMLAAQPQTEEASLLQWARSQGVEPPPPPDNVTEALAGCVFFAPLARVSFWRVSAFMLVFF